MIKDIIIYSRPNPGISPQRQPPNATTVQMVDAKKDDPSSDDYDAREVYHRKIQ
jgi:hypothetical protein